MIRPSQLPENVRNCYQQQLNSLLEGMRNIRYGWWAHWAQLAEVYLPRRYKWFITANQYNRGQQLNSAIVDETGVLAARTLSSGMMSGMTSATRPWFRLGLADLGDVDFGPVKDYLAECERRMTRVLGESNFYQAIAQFYWDLGVFGSSNIIIYEDPDSVIHCYNPCLGEFFFGASGKLTIETMGREFTLTISQVVDMFGYENCDQQTQMAYRQGGIARTNEVIVCHVIEPNSMLWEGGEKPLQYLVSRDFKYRECYWLRGNTGNHLLQIAGFREKPFMAGRWDVTSNDPYGRSPGMDALPAVRQLQIEQRRKAEAIDKMVRPPMNASINMRNEPASILPGAINYVIDVERSGFKPAFTVDPRLQEMTADIAEVQDRVRRVFFEDLFLMISNLDTVRTATEIDARREEKLILLGPVIERFENEVLDPIIDRVFAIMSRRGLFPEPPPEIAGREINVQYISMLAEAQRAVSTAGIERIMQIVGNMAAVNPDILDTVDWDKSVAIYADRLNVEPQIINSLKEIAAIRAQKAKAKQEEMAMAMTPELVDGAKTLSETNLGGGVTALEAML